MLALRRGVVLAAGDPGGPMQELEVQLGGDRRPALADVALVGPARMGDEVVVNLAAPDLVHVNLTRGLREEAEPGVETTKLTATSLQHAIHSVEAATSPRASLPSAAPVAVLLLHGQLAPLAWAVHEAAPGARLGYVQTAGGALPGGLSRVVPELRERGLLAGHLTAGPAYGGEGDAVTTAGALHHGFAERHWHAAVCGPGPGTVGSATQLGHGGLVGLDTAHTAAALGCKVVVARGPSHPTRTLLGLALVPFVVAGEPEPGLGDHDWRRAEADLDAYAASGLSARIVGRSLAEDPEPFAAALAAGSLLAGIMRAA